MGLEAGGKSGCAQKGMYRMEVEKAIDKFKCGKVAGVVGITA